MKKSYKSAWMQRHVNDTYVQQSVKKGYRSRATFKIVQIHERDKLFRPGDCVVDLGAAPGGWSQMLVGWVGRKGRVIALDRLAFDPIEGVDIIQGDFLADETLETLRASCPQGRVDWIVSDMAPNLSGVSGIDQPRMMTLAEAALAFADEMLKPKGGLLIKIFQGSGFVEFHRALRERFETVHTRKPDSSRSESSEIYLLARGFKVI